MDTNRDRNPDQSTREIPGGRSAICNILNPEAAEQLNLSAVEQYCDAFFEDFLGQSAQDSLGAAEAFLSRAPLTKKAHQDLEKGFYTPELSTVAQCFFGSLIKNAHRLKHDPKQQQSFWMQLYETFFSISPNIANYLAMPDRFIILAQLDRLHCPGYVNANIAGEMVYDLAFAHKDFAPWVGERLRSEDIITLLDVLKYCEQAAQQAYSAGYDSAEQAALRISEMAEQASQAHSSFFVQKSAQVTKALLARAKRDYLEFEYGRACRPMRIESLLITNFPDLSGQAQLIDARERHDTQIHRIASDAIGLIDENNLPESYGVIHDLPPASPDTARASRLQKCIHSLDYNSNDWRSLRRITIALLEFHFQEKEAGSNMRAFWRNIAGDKSNRLFGILDSLECSEADMPFLADLAPAIQAFMTAELAQIPRPSVRMQPYEDLTEDRHALPFGVADGDQLALLMRHLHSPPLRRLIEDELNISFASIPLRGQIQLLRYLVDKDQTTFSKLKLALKNAKENAPAVLMSFLACSQDRSLGDTVLQLAERAELLPLFAAYAELASQADTAATSIVEMYQANGQQLETTSVVKSLIAQGSAVLTAARTNSTTDELTVLIAKLDIARKQVSYTQRLVAQVRSSTGSLPSLDTLTTTEHREQSGSDLLREITAGTPLGTNMLAAIRKSFPGGSEELFLEFLADPSTTLHSTWCGSQLLAFFGTNEIALPNGSSATHIDWMTACEPGFAELSLTSLVREQAADRDFVADARPGAQSFPMLVEQLGFVATGDRYSEAGVEYLHCRRERAEQPELYLARQLDPDAISQLQLACDAAGEQTLIQRGRLHTCRVNLRDTAAEDWLMQQAEHYKKRGLVLSRFIPGKEKKVFYVVFEPDRRPTTAALPLAA